MSASTRDTDATYEVTIKVRAYGPPGANQADLVRGIEEEIDAVREYGFFSDDGTKFDADIEKVSVIELIK